MKIVNVGPWCVRLDAERRDTRHGNERVLKVEILDIYRDDKPGKRHWQDTRRIDKDTLNSKMYRSGTLAEFCLLEE